MQLRLLNWLQCPECREGFQAQNLGDQSEAIVQGALRCRCKRAVPVINGIPRFIDDWRERFPEFNSQFGGHFTLEGGAKDAQAMGASETWKLRTRKSFGYQWTEFGRMSCDFKKNFFNYLHPLQKGDFQGRLGLDAGCGFGRHLVNAAIAGAEMVGVDFSAAIDVAAKNTQGFAGVHLVQADLYHLPLRRGTFDIVYSLGVLHHLPDPQGGFEAIVPLAKPDGIVAVWLYSTSRRFTNAILEGVRFITRRLPLPLLRGLSYSAATVDWGLFIGPYRFLRRIPGLGRVVEFLALPRIKVYAEYSFQVAAADWFDRLSAPIRYYYGPADIERWFQRAGLKAVQISATGLYGWRACGRQPAAPAVLPSQEPGGQRLAVKHDV